MKWKEKKLKFYLKKNIKFIYNFILIIINRKIERPVNKD